MRARFIPLVALLVGATAARAQNPAPACDYTRCALTIIPRLNALDVVRGEREEKVGSLPFLLPGRTPAIFAGSDSALSHARRATGVRRIGAALTDLGGALILTGVIASTRRYDHSAPTGVVLAGAALVGLSVPVHFWADAELSRAVREYNRQFAR